MRFQFPPQPVPFVGRTEPLADVGARLADPDCRLLTLTGAGGSGKTRLAIEAAKTAEQSFAHGIAFVGLQPLNSSDLIVPAIAHALGFSFYGSDTPQEQLFHYLRDKSLLLLLDNFEHLLDGAALISDLLAHAAGVKVLVTSREALNLQEEWLYPLKGMLRPYSVYSEALEDYEAIQLFVYHARRMQPNFSLANELESVIRICCVAEGLPLAIELAASWLKALSAEQIASEMQKNFDFLATTARNVEERHRSMRAAFEQSWKLLSDEERLTFAKLSVFRGGFDRRAAEHIAGATLPVLAALVEKSLLNKQPTDHWDVHELLRQYGEEQLTSFGLLESVCAAHSHYYADSMRKAAASLKSPRQLEIVAGIESNFDNIRTAWNSALEFHREDVIDAMLDSLYQFGFFRGRFRETLEMFQRALDQRLTNRRLLGRLLARRWGYLHWLTHENYRDALDDTQEALDIATSAGDRFEIAICKLMIAYIWIHTQEYADARRILHESLDLFHALDEPFYECWVLHRIGYTYLNTGNIEAALDWTEKSLLLARSTPNMVALGNCLYNLGGFYLLGGNYDKGRRYCEEALPAALALGHKGQIAYTTALLSLANFLRGDFAESRRMAQEALQIGEDILGPIWQAYPLTALILLKCIEEDFSEAARLAGMMQVNDGNSIGFQLYYWVCAALAFGLEDTPDARRNVEEGLQRAHREGNVTIERALLPSAAYALAAVRPAQAIRLLAWVENSSDPATGWIRQWPRVERLHSHLRNRVGAEIFDQEWEIGTALDWKAIQMLLQSEFQLASAEAEAAQSLLEPLTQRELDVLNLLATGLTNPQIADQLVIGVGTVKTHTLSIYRKLDVANRSQAILRAQELGLTAAQPSL